MKKFRRPFSSFLLGLFCLTGLGHSDEWRYQVRASGDHFNVWQIFYDTQTGESWTRFPSETTTPNTIRRLLPSGNPIVMVVTTQSGTNSAAWRVEGMDLHGRMRLDSLTSWLLVAMRLDEGMPFPSNQAPRNVDFFGDQCEYQVEFVDQWREVYSKSFLGCGVGTISYSFSRLGGITNGYNELRLLTYNGKNIDSLVQMGVLISPTALFPRKTIRLKSPVTPNLDWHDLGLLLGRRPKKNVDLP
jgi:hypothetical protein